MLSRSSLKYILLALNALDLDVCDCPFLLVLYAEQIWRVSLAADSY